MIKTKEDFKKEYGFNTGDVKWVPKGGDLLKYIGASMIYVEFNKQPDGSYTTQQKECTVKGIDGFDPITMTYKIHYLLPPDKNVLTETIIPEGFTYDIMGNGTEDTMKRFIPLHLHAKILDEDVYYKRVEKLYDNRDTLDYEALKTLDQSKDQATTLQYTRNIVAAVKVPEICCFRVSRLKLRLNKAQLTIYDKAGNGYTMTATPDEASYKLVIGKEIIGDVKLIDLVGDENCA